MQLRQDYLGDGGQKEVCLESQVEGPMTLPVQSFYGGPSTGLIL